MAVIAGVGVTTTVGFGVAAAVGFGAGVAVEAGVGVAIDMGAGVAIGRVVAFAVGSAVGDGPGAVIAAVVEDASGAVDWIVADGGEPDVGIGVGISGEPARTPADEEQAVSGKTVKRSARKMDSRTTLPGSEIRVSA